MWIKEVKKQNSEKGKTFYQYQLTETYRVDKAVRQKSILYLGDHQLLREKANRRIIASLMKNLIRNTPPLSEDMLEVSTELVSLSELYYNKYLLKIAALESSKDTSADQEVIHYELVNPESTTVFDCREIGAESMSYNILERIGLRDYLKRIGWEDKWIDYALISIISRAVACSSEHKTERWLEQNSGLLELFPSGIGKVTRHHLYKVADKLYEIKDELEEFFYTRLTNMFEINDSIVIYDLTNTYFEGRKADSKIAKYGRSKEKRYDCKQVVLAAVINEQGFLKHSSIYEGNMSDPATFTDVIAQLEKSGNRKNTDQKQTIVMDAGIATEDNLLALKEKGYEYVCVSRSRLKDYKSIDITNPEIIKDKNGSEIKLKFISNEKAPDNWMYVESDGKTKKEESMLEKATERFELELSAVSKAASKKGGTKKLEKVWERIGRIKERNKRVHKYYDIEIESENNIVKEVKWRKKKAVETQARSGVYFIRTNCSIENESRLWQIYNTVREVESTFRCLKTDLSLRPVYHKTDENIEAHLNLGLLAYHIVAPIRYMLKQKGMNYGWQNIVRIMNSQKAVSVKQITKTNEEIIIRTCSRPNREVLEIYQSLGISSMPYRLKKFVVHH